MSSVREDGRYRDVALLGSGGMATVTLAQDTMLGRRVALKRVHAADDPRGLARLRREALVGASLNHPNLVAVYDVEVDGDGDLVIVMQYVAGDTLRDVIRGRGALPVGQALRILEGVAAGLDAIHQRGIVHRDVKPANILLGTDGAVKLADLGIAAVADRTQITATGAVMGTFSYMAPEQVEGLSSDRAMDIYALAAVAFEMLCGQKARPEPNPLALAHAIATRPPPDLRDQWAQAPAAAAAVLQRGMSSDPAQRPQTAGELVRRLRAALDPQTTQAVSPVPAVQPDARRGAGALAGARAVQLAPHDTRSVRQPVPPSMSRQPVPPSISRRQPAPPGAGRLGAARSEHGRRGPHAVRTGVIVVTLALIAVGVAVGVLSSGGRTSGSHPAFATSGAAHPPAHAPLGRTSTAGASGASSAGSAGKAGSSSRLGHGPSAAGAGPSTATAGASTAGAGGSSRAYAAAGGADPAGVVQSFYEDAAHHDYAAAWGLADANMRAEVNGYASFQAQQSAVRSITFHRAQTVAGDNASSATVEVQTTSVLVGQTRQCAGSARTLRAPGGSWMLDGISISCAPA